MNIVSIHFEVTKQENKRRVKESLSVEIEPETVIEGKRINALFF